MKLREFTFETEESKHTRRQRKREKSSAQTGLFLDARAFHFQSGCRVSSLPAHSPISPDIHTCLPGRGALRERVPCRCHLVKARFSRP